MPQAARRRRGASNAATSHALARRYIEQENTEVLRTHLTSSTYLSGTSDKGYKERRGYYRPRQ